MSCCLMNNIPLYFKPFKSSVLPTSLEIFLTSRKTFLVLSGYNTNWYSIIMCKKSCSPKVTIRGQFFTQWRWKIMSCCLMNNIPLYFKPFKSSVLPTSLEIFLTSRKTFLVLSGYNTNWYSILCARNLVQTLFPR